MIEILYYFIRDIMPLTLYVLYSTNKKIFPKNKYFILFVIPYLLFTLYSIIMMLLGYNAIELWGFWTIEAPIEWGITLMILLIIIYNKYKDIPYSVTLSYLMVSAGGYIYEIPIYVKKGGWMNIIVIKDYYMLYLHSEIISIILIYLLLRNKRFEMNKIISSCLIIYSMYFIICLYTHWLTYLSYMIGNWVYRIPTILLLLSILTGLDRRYRWIDCQQ